MALTTGKDSQIRKLTVEVEQIKDMSIDLIEGFRSRLKHKDYEIAELKKEITQLQKQNV